MTLENNNTVTQREHPAFEDDTIAPHRRPSDVGRQQTSKDRQK
jgi:hypothetical protein